MRLASDELYRVAISWRSDQTSINFYSAELVATSIIIVLWDLNLIPLRLSANHFIKFL